MMYPRALNARLLAITGILWLLMARVVPVQAQDAADAAPIDLAPMVGRVETELQQIRLLTERLNTSGKQDHNAILFRRDQRSLDLVKLMDQLTPLVMTLTEDDPQRLALLERLQGDFASAGQAVYERLRELDARVDRQAGALEEMEGLKRIEGEAYLQSLEQLRFHYYEALIDFSRTLQDHGLPALEVLKDLPGELFQYAETQVGKVEFTSAAIDELQSRLRANPADTELGGALQSLRLEHRRYLDDLRIAVQLMERLDVDSAPYRTVMVQQGDTVTIDLLDPGVLAGMTRDTWKRMRQSVVESAPDGLFRLLLFLGTVLLFFWFARVVRRMTRSALDRSTLNMTTLLKDLLVSVSAGVVIVLGLLMALSQVGISLGPMLAGLGVAGFIVGFALQDTLSNFASGAMILIYRPYDVDDYVEVAGIAGLVKKMTLVSTTIATIDNQILVVPNNKIWGDVIKNVTAQRVRRVDMTFGISYRDDIPRTEAVLADIVDNHEKILKSPEPQIRLHTLGDSSVNFVVRPWVRTEDYWEVYWAITREVKMRFDREGISIPFPQRDVHLYQE